MRDLQDLAPGLCLLNVVPFISRHPVIDCSGLLPSWSSRSPTPARAPDRPLHRSRASRRDEYSSHYGSPRPSDREERAVGADHSQGRDRLVDSPELNSSVSSSLEVCLLQTGRMGLHPTLQGLLLIISQGHSSVRFGLVQTCNEYCRAVRETATTTEASSPFPAGDQLHDQALS